MSRGAKSKITRVGVIGAGNWALHGHLRVLSLLPQFDVVAIQSRRRAAAETAALRFGISRVADTADQILAMADVDLVAVLTTAPQHQDDVLAVIAAGKNVYCEWPLTVSSAVAEELCGAAHSAGIRHTVGLQRRLAPHNRYLRDILADGYVGKMRSVRLHVSMNYFQAKRPLALRWTVAPENFSSVIAIYAGHFLDMLFYAVGRPASVSALTINQFGQIEIAETREMLSTTNPDELVVAGTLVNGAALSIHIEGGKRNGSGVQLDITGDEGDIRVTNRSAFGDVGDDYLIEGAHGDNVPLELLPIPSSYNWLPESDLPSAVLELGNLYTALARDIAEQTLVSPNFDDALWMHRLLETFEQSSVSGKRVNIPPRLDLERAPLIHAGHAVYS